MTKYIIWTDHRAGYNHEDKKIPLEAQNIVEAMREAAEFCSNDTNLYCVCLFEKASKDEYRQVLRSANGISFHPEESNCKIVKKTAGSGKAKLTWYEVA